jgi:hypothetical protein
MEFDARSFAESEARKNIEGVAGESRIESFDGRI